MRQQLYIIVRTVTTQLHNSFWSLLSPLDLEKEMETTVEEVE